ncbi:SDR family oxidoreductase [bacterium]|nr:MAG: SDR family oxidoreductase [bacterium]
MEQLLAGKNVFITGAGANIGRAIALEMAEQGANIYFAEIDAARSAALEQELQANGTTTQGFVCDVSRATTIEDILQQLNQRQVAIDILVNNVGITDVPREATLQSFETWQQVMDTNVLGPLYLSRIVAQNMIDRGTAGSILFITSVHQWVYHGSEVYSATKAGLGMIIDELAVLLAQHNIRVNGIAPGSCIEAPDGLPIRNNGTPLYHESVKPCYIGRAAVFLSSDYFSRHTTGAVLKIDGGLSLYAFNNRDIICPPVTPSFPRARRLARRGLNYLGKIRRLSE